MPCCIEGVAVLVEPEGASLVDITAVLFVENLVATSLGILLDNPLLTLGVDNVALSLEHGEVAHTVGTSLCIGQILAIDLDEVFAILDSLYGEVFQTIGVILLVCLYGFSKFLVEPGGNHVTAYNGLCLYDRTLVVAADDGLLLLLQLQLCTIVANECHGVLLRQGSNHIDILLTTQAQIAHAFNPRLDLVEHFGIVHLVGQ